MPCIDWRDLHRQTVRCVSRGGSLPRCGAGGLRHRTGISSGAGAGERGQTGAGRGACRSGGATRGACRRCGRSRSSAGACPGDRAKRERTAPAGGTPDRRREPASDLQRPPARGAAGAFLCWPVDLNADGSIRHIDVLRYPRQAKDTTQIAIDAVRRAAPFGDVSHLPRPWRFTETFLFNDDRRFKPRTLDDR
ncbi:MAG: hypothetical protein V9G29_01315 [Burkholderiaceae bacterium]